MSKEKGFTLIETMIALLVISVSLMALASLLIVNMKVTHQSEQKIDHTALAQAAMSNVVSLVQDGYTQADAQTAVRTQLSNMPYLNSSATVTISPDDTSQGLKVITVKLDWKTRGDTKTLSLLSAVVKE